MILSLLTRLVYEDRKLAQWLSSECRDLRSW